MSEGVTFKLAKHAFTEDAEMCEVWSGGQLVGALYASDGAIRFVSKYIEAVHLDERAPPVVNILLKGTLL